MDDGIKAATVLDVIECTQKQQPSCEKRCCLKKACFDDEVEFQGPLLNKQLAPKSLPNRDAAIMPA